MARLAALPRIVGVKNATADLARIALKRAGIGDNFSYFPVEDSTALAYHAMGGDGCISVSAKVAPRWRSQLQMACRLGDYSRARTWRQSLLPLHSTLTLQRSPAGIKYAVSVLGLCSEQARLPIMPLSQATKEAIAVALVQ
jgi:4-hydroxy-tetrahydrodipicolinate synthase